VSSSEEDVSETQPAGEHDTRTRTRTTVAERYITPGNELSVSSIGPDRLPREIGKYAVTGYLGRGGMGVVLSALDTELDRPVALKLLHGALGDKARSRMEREAQAMAKLAHPNVVTVYEVGRAGDLRFIAMELVTGVTLRAWMREPRSWRQTLAMMIAAGRGLAAAHAAGLVHRDFKPDNVLIGSDERPRVTDFGLVASQPVEVEGTGDHDGPSVIGGTPAYMPPEQWDGGEIDARADQYAFAITCWEALWGKRPFATREARAGEPERIGARRGVPRRVEVALRRAIHKDRDKRWPKLAELLDRLEHIARDRRAVIAAVAAVLLVAVAAMAFKAGGGTPESPCRTAGAPLDKVWGAARSAKLQAGYAQRKEPAALQVWKDTERVLQSWADEHRAVRIETCELGRSGGTGLKALTDARVACLDQRLGLFDALATALGQPDTTTIQYAREAALELPRSTACKSVVAAEASAELGSAPPRDVLAQAHADVARATALRTLGKPREAVAAVEPAAKQADQLGWRPLIAESYLELGLDRQALKESDEGQKALKRAAGVADASRDDVLRFRATLAQSDSAIELSKYDEAAQLIESARMIADRLPDEAERQIALASQEAFLRYWTGEFGDCVKRSRDAIALVEKTVGRNTIIGIRLRFNLSRCLTDTDDSAKAGAPIMEALEIIDATTGRDHPLGADALSGLGSIARDEDRPADALKYFQEALAIRERIFGPDNPEVGKMHNNIGNALNDLGRDDEARRSLQRAIDIWTTAWGADSPAIAVATGNLGNIEMEAGNFALAEAHFRHALEIRRAKRPPGHRDIAKNLVKLGTALLAQKKPECLPYLREAVEAFKTNEAQTELKDEGRFMLGRALFELGTDRAQGRTMMDAACAAYDTKNDPFECRKYLAKLPR
jgi:eukaryotic-like serine/threonine-protein kinase